MKENMKQGYRVFLRPWGTYYFEDLVTGKQETLKTRDKNEAFRLVAAKNENEKAPAFSLHLARVYWKAGDPAGATRTWQHVMDEIPKLKKGNTRHRWLTAIRDKALDSVRTRVVLETQAEHFLKVLEKGSVCTNIYLRRIHNFALDMNWLPWPVLPKKRWPVIKFKEKRGITWEEHQAIVTREQNPERKAFYQLAWHLTLKFAREVNGAMQAFVVGNIPEFIFQIDGKFRSGTKYATFEGSLPNSALSVTTTVSAEGILKREPHQLGLSFNPDKWVGQPLMQLAYFDAIHRFVGNISEARPIRLKFLSDGNDLFGTEFSGLDPKPVAEMRDIVELLQKARFIARRFGMNPPLPPLGSISGTQLKAIEDVYDLLHHRDARMPKPNFRLSFKGVGGPIRTGAGPSGVLQIDSPRYDFDILGSKIQLGPITHLFTCATMASATPLDDGGTDIVMTGSDKSEWIMKLQNPQPE